MTPVNEPRLGGPPADDALRPTAAQRARRFLRYGLIGLTLVLVVDALVGDKGLLTLLQAREQYRAVERALERERAANQAMRDEAYQLRTSARAIEDAARRELGLIKPGEKVFIIRDVPSKK
jgi:cell division protein FtsB